MRSPTVIKKHPSARPAPASPFLKWAGGKAQLLGQLSPLLPAEFGRYIEVFVGGGALFFHLFNLGRMAHGAILNDLDRELINCYRVLQDNANVKELVALLGRHACQSMDADYYYGIRAWDRDPHFLERRSPIQRAARMIFLNHTCFNGLYRLNSKGQFNVPYGKWAAPPTVFVEDNLLACHRALQGVELKQESFEACREWARKGDFVYLDPPYVPLSRTSNFTSYTGTPFTQQDQRRLASVFERLDAIGCKVLLSNSDNAAVSELFGTDGRHIKRAVARRNINSKGAARGAIGELIVSNYPV